MSTYFERAALIGVGIVIGLALSRTTFDTAAVPIYVVASAAILGARWAVDRHRERKSRRA